MAKKCVHTCDYDESELVDLCLDISKVIDTNYSSLISYSLSCLVALDFSDEDEIPEPEDHLVLNGGLDDLVLYEGYFLGITNP
jgi:hypothetical protein